jgi:hypothetical protein
MSRFFIKKKHIIFTAADRRCRYSRRGISIAPGGMVAGVYQSDSIRGTALGKCFYPGIDVEQEQTPMNREQAELTEKRLGFGKRSAGFQHGAMVK